MKRRDVNLMNKVLNYIPKDSFIHRLSGTTKLIIFLTFSILCGASFDTRVLLGLFALSILGFILSKIELKEIRVMTTFLAVFLTLNFLLLFLFNPEYGCEMYNSRTVLFHLGGRYYVTVNALHNAVHSCYSAFLISKICLKNQHFLHINYLTNGL